jgi:hypothetical protein
MFSNAYPLSWLVFVCHIPLLQMLPALHPSYSTDALRVGLLLLPPACAFLSSFRQSTQHFCVHPFVPAAAAAAVQA